MLIFWVIVFDVIEICWIVVIDYVRVGWEYVGMFEDMIYLGEIYD